jgi:flagellar export protein FliJ
MKAFKSSLQALRTLRERQEQTALTDYGKALQAQEQARNKLDEVQHDLSAGWEQFHKKLRTKCAARELSQLQAYLQAVERRKKEAEHALKVARNHAGNAFTRLLAARQARAVVDKLGEAQKRRYQRKLRRKEQKELDELASRRNALFTLLQLTREPLWN